MDVCKNKKTTGSIHCLCIRMVRMKGIPNIYTKIQIDVYLLVSTCLLYHNFNRFQKISNDIYPAFTRLSKTLILIIVVIIIVVIESIEFVLFKIEKIQEFYKMLLPPLKILRPSFCFSESTFNIRVT